MRKLFVISALLIGAMSCKNEDSDFNLPVAKLSECEEIDFSECIGFEEFVQITPKFEMPCFNPSRNDEFIYRQGNKLWRFNLDSRISELVLDGVRPITQPSWSTSGFLTFTQSDWKVWIMRDDGSDLKQISSTPRDMGPEFNSTGDMIVYGRGMEYSGAELENNPELRKRYKLIVCSLDGIELDSFCRQVGSDQCYPWDLCAWSPTSSTFAAPDNGVAIYDLQGSVLDRVYHNSDGLVKIFDIEWTQNGDSLIVSDNLGIHAIDLKSGNKKMLKESCNSNGYGDISISEDGRTIIASRSTSTYADCVITTKTGIVRMNIDGSEEEELLMP